MLRSAYRMVLFTFLLFSYLRNISKNFYSIFKLGTLRIWIPLHGKWKLLRELRDPIGSHVNQLPFCTGHNGDIAVYSFFIQISGTKSILSQLNLKLDWINTSSFQSIKLFQPSCLFVLTVLSVRRFSVPQRSIPLYNSCSWVKKCH